MPIIEVLPWRASSAPLSYLVVTREPLTETNSFTGIERRRNPAVPPEHREAGEVAVFHELGKALTSSLQLDQVLRTIMEKIDEFLHPDTWSMLLVDEAKQELYFELAIGKNAHTPEGRSHQDGAGHRRLGGAEPAGRHRSRRQPGHTIFLARWTRRPRWRRVRSWPCRCAFATIAWA